MQTPMDDFQFYKGIENSRLPLILIGAPREDALAKAKLPTGQLHGAHVSSPCASGLHALGFLQDDSGAHQIFICM